MPGIASLWEWHRRSTCCYASRRSRRQLRAWPGSGGGGLCSWTGSLLSTPRAADFEPVALRGRWRGAQLDQPGRGVCSLRRAPLTFCLARRRRRRGADREFAFYASCRRHRAWPGGGGSGARAGRRYFFPCLTPPTLGLARSGQGRGAQLDGLTFGLGMETVWRQRGAGLDDELAFFGSRRESAPTSGLTRRWRWWGALPWPGVCFSIFHSPAS